MHGRQLALKRRGNMPTPPVVLRIRRYILLLGLALFLGATISGSGPALSALPSGGAVATASTWGTRLTIERPATTAAGDVLVASVNARLSSSASISAPAGWSLIRQDSSAPGYRSLTQALYYRVAGASEPAGYDWSLSSASSATGAVLDFKNVDRTTPIDAHSGAFMPEHEVPDGPIDHDHGARRHRRRLFRHEREQADQAAERDDRGIPDDLGEPGLGAQRRGLGLRAVRRRAVREQVGRDHWSSDQRDRSARSASDDRCNSTVSSSSSSAASAAAASSATAIRRRLLRRRRLHRLRRLHRHRRLTA